MMWGWGYGGPGHWMGWLGPLFMVAVWGSIITGGVFLVRSLARHVQPRGDQDSSLEILKGRYSRGEIGKQEYEEKRGDLS